MNTRHTDVIETEWDDRAVEQAVDEAIAAGRTRARPSRMKLGDYNGFPGDLHALADRKVKVAIELKLIPPPGKCSICKTTDGLGKASEGVWRRNEMV